MMLIRAELAKLASQRGALFWGFVALPAFLFVIACVFNGAVPQGTGASVEVHPVRALLRGLGAAGNPLVHLFLAVGAAAFFAAEYRHATWRLLVPRRSRAASLGAKLAAFLIAAATSLVLLSLGTLVAIFALPLVRGVHPLAAEPFAAGAIAILLTLLVSMLQLAGLAAWVALMAVVTRSTMGAILPPFLLSFGSAAAQAYLGGEPGKLLLLPGAAPELLRAGIAYGFDGTLMLSPGRAMLALLVTAGWFAVPMAAALFLFARQDLARE